MSTQTEEKISIQALQKQSLEYPTQAKNLAVIKTEEDYKSAANFLLTIKGFRKQVSEAFDPIVGKARAAWQAVVDLRKKADGPLDEAERIVKGAMTAYSIDQERQRQEAEEKALADARKAEEEARLKQAAEAEKNGNFAVAQHILETPQAIAPVVIPKQEKVAGIAVREVWKVEVVDMKAFLKAVVENHDLQNLVFVNTTALGQMARALKSNLKIPGVRVWAEKITTAKVA